MLNRKNEFICDWKGCGKLATRVVSYYRDTPTDTSGDPKTEAFCDRHAETEMHLLQKPGCWVLVRWDGTEEGCVLHELSNFSIEDCCSREENKKGQVVVRIGRNEDPATWGFPGKSRGTAFVLKSDGSTSAVQSTVGVKDLLAETAVDATPEPAPKLRRNRPRSLRTGELVRRLARS